MSVALFLSTPHRLQGHRITGADCFMRVLLCVCITVLFDCSLCMYTSMCCPCMCVCMCMSEMFCQFVAQCVKPVLVLVCMDRSQEPPYIRCTVMCLIVTLCLKCTLAVRVSACMSHMV